jgi:hypothetical protein
MREMASVAETDILNPTTEFWKTLNDSPNPSFGFERRSASNSSLSKARLGAPYSRETMNDGFAFSLTYLNRPWSTILRLKYFYEAFKGGYFTYIDYDGGGRHHVGRFTTPIYEKEIANGSYSVQSVVFQEMPQARMLKYPCDFVNWSRTINVLDDFMNQAVATYSVTAGAWALQLNPALVAPSVTDPTAYEIYNAAPTLATVAPANCDWAQIQYVGWGFRMQFRQAANLGQVAILVDGAPLCIIDLSSGSLPVGSAALPSGVTVANGLLTVRKMPLDMHRVMVQAYAANAGAGTAAIFPAVTVIV